MHPNGQPPVITSPSERENGEDELAEQAGQHADTPHNEGGENGDDGDDIHVEMSERRRVSYADDVGNVDEEEGDNSATRSTDEEDIDQEERRRRAGDWRGSERTAEAVLQYDFAIDMFENKARALQLGSDLRVYILFVIMFCIFFLVTRDIEGNFYLVDALFYPLARTEVPHIKQLRFFDDITGAAEFNDWAMDVMLRQIFTLDYDMGGNVLLGAIQMRTKRVRKDSCAVNTDIVPATMPAVALECYGAFTVSNEDNGVEDNWYNSVTRWRYADCSELPGSSVVYGQMGTYDCGGYIFTVPFWSEGTDGDIPPFPSKNYTRIMWDVAQNLYLGPPLYNDPPFIDNLATRVVFAEFFAYNPYLQSFISVRMFCEEAAGGMWVPNYEFRAFYYWTTDSLLKTVYDAVFYVFVFYYIFLLFVDVVKYYRREGRILAYLFNIWNLLEIANLAIFLVVAVVRIMYIAQCIKTDIRLDELAYRQEYPGQLEPIMTLYMLQIYLNCVNTIFTFMKMLKFFRLNDRLNVLTRTLSQSQDSIIGVLLIFFLIVTAFAMTGHGLFGLGVWNYRTVDASYSTLLQTLVGIFDYEALKNENRIEAGFFFWAYIILAAMCLLNFVIGVLIEAFAEVSSTKAALPLDSAILKTASDWKRLLHPKSLWKGLKQQLKGTSRPTLLLDAVEMLKQYRDIKYPEDDVTPIQNQFIDFNDYVASIDPNLADQVGTSYMVYIWDDLVYEFDVSRDAQEAVEAARSAEMASRGVKMAMDTQLRLLETFAPRMKALERDVLELLMLVDSQDGLPGMQQTRPM